MGTTRRTTRYTIDILLVEDSPTDAYFARTAFGDVGTTTVLHEVTDGQDALDFVFREGAFADAPRPDLILLDLNLPRVDGREVLRRVKSEPELRSIPVVVLSSSRDEAEIDRVYDLHANSYVIKPADFTRYPDLARRIERFWLGSAALPHPGRPRAMP